LSSSVLAKFIVYFSRRSGSLEQILTILEEVAAEVNETIQIEKVSLEDCPDLVFSEGVLAAPATDVANGEIHRFIGIPPKQDLIAILSMFKEVRRIDSAD